MTDARMRAAAWPILFGALLFAHAAAGAEPERAPERRAQFSGPEIIGELRAGGHVILIRHMATDRTSERPGPVDLTKCATQRVLSDEGRLQAEELGRAFRKLGILVGTIVVSPYCRCVETASLAFGENTPRVASKLLSVWDDLPMQEKNARAAEMRQLLDTPPSIPGTNTVLVTHSGNILWSMGLDPRPEGRAHVFLPSASASGDPSYLGSVLPSDWREVAGLERTAPQGPELADQLYSGGLVLMMRHAATTRERDAEKVDLADCSTQRGLSEEGRRQAEAIGAAFRELEIPVGQVLSSPYCRCIDTGRLAFGEVEVSPALESWDGLDVGDKAVRGSRVRAMLNTPPATGENTILITHSGNLIWSLGLDAEPEGLVHVFRPTDLGRAIHLGRIRPAEWGALAQGASTAAPADE
jgi:broad specificity phosphatase PhoE